MSESPISDAFQHLVDSGQVTEEILAPLTGALRQAITPLLDQQSALAETLSASVLASTPKIGMAQAMKPLLDQQSALAETLNASFAKIDMSPVLKPLADQQAALADAVGASTLAAFAKIDMSSVMKPLLDQHSALAETLSASALASIPKIGRAQVMKPLLDQQSALAETLNASFAKIDMSPVLKPLADQQAALADAVGASTLAAFAKVDMSSVLKPLLDAADSFASIPGLLSLDRGLTIRADEWFGGFDDEVQSEARQLASSLADDVGLPVSDPAAPLLLATMLIAIVLTWRVEIDLQAAAVGAVRSAVVTGRFAAEFAEQVDERLPQIQNLYLWLLILLHVFCSRRRSAGESSPDA